MYSWLYDTMGVCQLADGSSKCHGKHAWIPNSFDIVVILAMIFKGFRAYFVLFIFFYFVNFITNS